MIVLFISERHASRELAQIPRGSCFKIVNRVFVVLERQDVMAARAMPDRRNDALGDDVLRRTPATPDMIVASLEAGKRVDSGLTTHV